MQFKGSVRAPGDRDPGVRVVLEIDEYHLEIRRDSELIGRYYLADVEVARDIAERFILFLGEDEVEFLADDALQFAYGGVTAMQDAWLEAQKKKRRHRRAAEAAARRKDDDPRIELEEPMVRPLHVSDSDTIRSRRLQAGAPTRSPADSRPAAVAREASNPAEPSEVRTDTLTDMRKKRNPPAAKPVSVAKAPVAPVAKSPVAEAPAARANRKKATESGAAADSRSRAKPSERATVEDVIADEAFAEEAILDQTITDANVAGRVVGEETEDTSLAARRRKITAEAKPAGAHLGKVRVPEPVSRKDHAPAPASIDAVPIGAGAETPNPKSRVETVAPVVEDTEVEIRLDNGGDVRFAQEGHHPFETSTGLLGKLRRAPKRPVNHVHKFKESGSSVGLVRRVCIECAYVSIGSEDD